MSVLGWVAVALGIVVALMLLAEIALRSISGRLRPLPQWVSWEVHNKFVAAENLAAAGGASIVAIGTSAVNASIEPQLLSTISKRPRPSFNAALNGSSPHMLELWILDVIVPLLHPEVVLIGLDSSQMNEGNVLARRNYDRFVQSQAWGESAGTGRGVQRAIWWLSNHSLLVRYRRFLFKRSLFQQDPLQRSTSCRRLGLLRWVMVFRYRPYSVKTRQMDAWKDALNEYSIGDDEVASFGRTIDGLKALDVTPILAPIPYTEDWVPYHPRGRQDVDDWNRVIRRIATDHDCAFVDLADHFDIADHFADPVHVNGEGQSRFTNLIAEAIAEVSASASR